MYFEAFIAETYVQLAATDANVLRAQALRSETSYWRMLSGQVLTGNCSLVVCVVSCVISHTVLCGDLYTACVDASRTVFWDRSHRTTVLLMSLTCASNVLQWYN